ncbi:MAG: CocE/NonD family hydrolase [Armatimonadetes bacterium]|nr:CocE/NonD family hydrolase [Armatimonadota bacterium]
MRPSTVGRKGLLVLLFSVMLAPLAAQAPPSKQTVGVPMQDGKKLATDIYLPTGQGKFPVILARTPYDKAGGAGFGMDGVKHGYAVVVQDTRGRWASEGENLPFIGDGWWEGHQDGSDTLEWLIKQPWCNGKIGTWGGSALGITQLGLAGTGTKLVSAQQIVVGAPNFYPYLTFPGGVFKKAMIEDWLAATKHDPKATQFWSAHPTFDSFWKQFDMSSRWGKVNTPAVHLGGWYDIFGQGTIDSFVGYQTKGGVRARGKQVLVMGPWTHGVLQNKAGELTFPNGSRPPNKVSDTWLWFDYHLKGIQNGFAEMPAVTYYVMGDTSDPRAPGNVWRTADAWPPMPTKATPLYLASEKKLILFKPKQAANFTYTYDPANPTPTAGGPQLTLPSGAVEQSKVESRSDVVVFTSDILAEPLEVTGRVTAKLWISSTALDTDFTVKLCDVYPDGRSYNICEGVLRTRFRKGFDREVFLKVGEVVPVEIDLWSTSILFNKGHRLRVQVASSSFPGYDPNPNTGAGFRANAERRVAQNTIHTGSKFPSYVLLPIPIQSKEGN